MPAQVTCGKGGQLEVPLGDVWIWSDRWQVGYGYWCPCCQVQHRGLTSKQKLIALIDHGVTVRDEELFPEAA